MQRVRGIYFLIFILTASLSPIFSGCQQSDPAGTSSQFFGRVSGRAMPESEVRSVIAGVGFPTEAVNRMVCTAWYESNWHTSSYNTNRNGSTDFGLLQINSVHWRGCGVTRTSLADPEINARCGLKVFRSQGLRAWYGYRNHRHTCDAYTGGKLGLIDDNMASEEQNISGDESTTNDLTHNIDRQDIDD